MKSERKNDQFSTLRNECFSDKFFTIPEDKKSVEVNQHKETVKTQNLTTDNVKQEEQKPQANNSYGLHFPLPESAELLNTFLKDNKDSYLKGVKAQVTELKEWAQKQKINAATLDDFYINYFVNYSNGNAAVSFMLFSEGVYYLYKINQALTKDHVPLDVRISTVKNLLLGLSVCPPGVYTNIQNAYLALSGDLTIDLMCFRRQLAEQLLTAEISKKTVINNQGEYYYEIDNRFYLHYGNMIHCVNAVIDVLQTQLAINPSRDIYTNLIDVNLIKFLVEKMASVIFNSMTKETLLAWIINNKLTNLKEIETRMKSFGFNNELIEIFSRELDHFGIDERFNFNQLILEKDGNITINPHAEYFLNITLMERLRNSNYITYTINQSSTLSNEIYHFVMNKDQKDLEYSFVEVTRNYNGFEAKEFVPAIPYLGEDINRCHDAALTLESKTRILLLNELTKSLPDTISKLFPRLEDNKFESKNIEEKGDKNKIEFIEKLKELLIKQYFASAHDGMPLLNQRMIDILLLIPNPYRMDIISDSQLYYNNDTLGKKLSEIVTNLNDLVYVFTSECSSWQDFVLKDKFKHHIIRLINEPKDLLFLLNHLKPINFTRIVQCIGNSHLQKMVPSNVCVGKIFNKLFESFDADFMTTIGSNYLKSICVDMYDFIEALDQCPKFPKFYFDYLGKEHIEKILEDGALWFETLKLLSPHLKEDFLFACEADLIKSNIKNCNDLTEYF